MKDKYDNAQAEIADLKRDFNSMGAAREVTMTERDQARAEIATLKAANAALTAGICDGCKTAKAEIARQHEQWKETALAHIQSNATANRLEFENAALRGVIIEAMRGVGK